MPPLLVVSSEGSAMYGTTDLATILERKRTFGPDLVIYCVDQRQADHFEIVFRAAYLAGYAKEGQLEHVGFGTMNGTDGKPFKTREGGVLKLNDMIEMTREKARERLHEAGLGENLPPAEFEEIAGKVAVAALKFADLQNFRGTSYVFDLDRFTSFEGKTGPYLLYQAVRVKSLLRRAAEEGVLKAQGAPGPIAITEPAERELALTLDAFETALAPPAWPSPRPPWRNWNRRWTCWASAFRRGCRAAPSPLTPAAPPSPAPAASPARPPVPPDRSPD